jgi:hypothetical protein
MQKKIIRRDTRLGLMVAAVLVLALSVALLVGCASNPASSSSSANTGNAGNSSSGNGSNGNSGDSGNSPSASVAPPKTSSAAAQEIKKGGALTIPVADVSAKARFYPVAVDGTEMEIIAVKAPDGTLRTAFNTCQVCYDSGRGYYEQVGDKLVCQNCGNQFAMSRVEVEAGGCNPWPIFAEDKTVTSKSIEISYNFLQASKTVFANWKTDY